MSGTLRRITEAEVRAAVEKTGFRLVADMTLDAEKGCGCPLGVVAVAAGFRALPGRSLVFMIVEHLGLTTLYAGGLMNGVDRARRAMPQSEAYNLGYDDGRAIRAALMEAQQQP